MNDLNPEHALLGIALHKGEIVDEVPINGADFHEPRGEAVWETISRLQSEGKPADPTTVLASLPRDARGIDPVWLAELYGAAPVPALAEHYARLVQEASTRRRLTMATVKIQQAVNDGVPAAEAVQHARGWIDACQTDAIGATAYIGDHMDDLIDSLSKEPELTPTPWIDLNHIIGGWRPGALYIIGARPGVGKTIVSTQAAVELARHGHVAVNNLEMSRREVMIRVTSQTTGVHLGRLLDRKMTADDWAKVTDNAPHLANLPLSVDDSGGATLAHIRAHARSVARKGKLAGVVVDYIGLMTPPPGPYRARHEVVGEFSRGLKLLAQEMHVPVIALAQLNRNSAGADTAPRMSELRESGSLEQDSDVVMLLHTDLDSDGSELNVNVAKNRHGPTGALQLARRGHLARVDNFGREW